MQFAQVDKQAAVAVLPVGAIEQHGPHLPVSVDTTILVGLIDRLVESMPDELLAYFLPVLPYGKSNEHADFPGTLSLSGETLLSVVLEIGASVAASGFRRLVLLNSHGGQSPVLDIAARDLRIKHNMLVVSSNWFSLGMPEGLFSERELNHGVHAGQMETSVMQCLDPRHVDMSQAQDFVSLTEELAEENRHLSLKPGGKLGWKSQDLNPHGACGDARSATPEAGQAVIDNAVQQIVALLQEVARFPLSRLDRVPSL
ncbi:MAG: creatininase family protein [Planctomycetota bacterium]